MNSYYQRSASNDDSAWRPHQPSTPSDFDIDQVIRFLPEERHKDHVAPNQKLFYVDRNAKRITDKRPGIFGRMLGANFEVYCLTQDGSTALSPWLNYKLRDSDGRPRIIQFRYRIHGCDLNRGGDFVSGVISADNPANALCHRICSWLDAWVVEEQRNKLNPVTNFSEVARDRCVQRLTERASTLWGIDLEVMLRPALPDNPDGRPARERTYQTEPFDAELRGLDDEVKVKVEAVVRYPVSEEGQFKIAGHLPMDDEVVNQLLIRTLDHLKSYVTLEMLHGSGEEVNADLKRSVVVPYFEKEIGLSVGAVKVTWLRDPWDKWSFPSEVTEEVSVTLVRDKTPVKVNHQMQLSLIQDGGFARYRRARRLDWEQYHDRDRWMKNLLRECTQSVFWDKRYVEVMTQFELAQVAIEEMVRSRAAEIGWDVTLLVTRTDDPTLSPFINKQAISVTEEGKTEYETADGGVMFGLKISAQVKFYVFEKIGPYIKPGSPIAEYLTEAIRDAAKVEIGRIPAKDLYTVFTNFDILATKGKLELARKLTEGYLELIQMIPKDGEVITMRVVHELERRYQDIVSRGPRDTRISFIEVEARETAFARELDEPCNKEIARARLVEGQKLVERYEKFIHTNDDSPDARIRQAVVRSLSEKFGASLSPDDVSLTIRPTRLHHVLDAIQAQLPGTIEVQVMPAGEIRERVIFDVSFSVEPAPSGYPYFQRSCSTRPDKTPAQVAVDIISGVKSLMIKNARSTLESFQFPDLITSRPDLKAALEHWAFHGFTETMDQTQRNSAVARVLAEYGLVVKITSFTRRPTSQELADEKAFREQGAFEANKQQLLRNQIMEKIEEGDLDDPLLHEREEALKKSENKSKEFSRHLQTLQPGETLSAALPKQSHAKMLRMLTGDKRPVLRDSGEDGGTQPPDDTPQAD